VRLADGRDTEELLGARGECVSNIRVGPIHDGRKSPYEQVCCWRGEHRDRAHEGLTTTGQYVTWIH
jgi:hypothetical protein